MLRSSLFLLASAFWTPRAEAWNCIDAGICGCDWAGGSQFTYQLNVNDFTTAEEDHIQDGAHAWDAGSAEINRGADWDFVRSDNTSDGTWGNGVNNVRMKNDTWFTDNGYGAGVFAATHNTLVACVRNDSDITFRDSVIWETSLPSDGADNSIGQFAVHEFGHSLGLDHENSYLATMNTDHPFGGDIAGATYRINEDDYVGLTNAKPDSSTGRTLMLSKFSYEGGGASHENWTTDSESGKTWHAPPGGTISGVDGPKKIQALINGTASVTTSIRWQLSADTSCFSGTEYALGTVNLTIGSNTPFAVQPSTWSVPSGTPANTDYYLCAKIDPDDATSETSETDNKVRSDKLFHVD